MSAHSGVRVEAQVVRYYEKSRKDEIEKKRILQQLNSRTQNITI